MPRAFSLWTMSIVVALASSVSLASDLKVGFATVDITPPIGYRMSGYFSERPSTGVKDPLYAKAIYFEQGQSRAAIVVCDLIGFPAALSHLSRHQAEQELGLPAKNISITATHSHTGPLFSGVLRDFFHEQAMLKNNGKDPREDVDYPGLLVLKIVESLRKAQLDARPTRIASGFAVETRLSFNRRFHMRDGTVRFNPGEQNPDIVRVAGPIDPQVGLVAFQSIDGQQIRGALTTFALHLDTVSGTEYSGDYPKYLQDGLGQSFGENFFSAFAAGTCGDINHIDVSVKKRRSAEQIGSLLAETVQPRLRELTVSEARLATASAKVQVPLQVVSTEQINAATIGLFSIGDSTIPFLTQVQHCKVVGIAKHGQKTIDLEVRVFRLTDDTAIVTLPGEVFVELGLEIKRRSPFAKTIVVELADDCPAYIPTTKAFSEGSYETVNSVVQPGSGEAMVESAIQLLNELQIAR